VAEHRLCHRSAGLFDIDHMGQLIIRGKGAGEALSALVSNRILDMRAGGARDPWLVVVNAGSRETDLAWFRERLSRGIEVEDVSGAVFLLTHVRRGLSAIFCNTDWV
jgi:glycine cleavage system aminomethyltransferase T